VRSPFSPACSRYADCAATPTTETADIGARRAVWLLGAVLALESADLSAVGAVGPGIERSFAISHTELGLLASVSPIAAALATVPAGIVADRFRRTPLLAAGVGTWALTMLAAGAAPSLGALLAGRAALGALTAAAMPIVLSLTGDYFDAKLRARCYGRIAAGELVGSGFGFLVGGNLAAPLSWRWAFWILVAPAIVLAIAIWRGLPERPRGGGRPAGGGPPPMTLMQAIRYVLGVRTNVMLLVAGATGNFFYAGVRTFTVVFIRGHYGLGQTIASSAVGLLGLGALAGVLAGGRLADALLARGRPDARLLVAGVATIASAALWIPPLLATAVPVGLGVGLLAAAVMSMPNAPIDAARLDVVPARLRGRGESVRSLLRALAFSLAPLSFGLAAELLGGSHGRGAGGAFLVMLVPLALSGVVVLAARSSYPSDVARATARDARADGGARRSAPCRPSRPASGVRVAPPA
jgi:MFS family permease